MKKDIIGILSLMKASSQDIKRLISEARKLDDSETMIWLNTNAEDILMEAIERVEKQVREIK